LSELKKEEELISKNNDEILKLGRQEDELKELLEELKK